MFDEIELNENIAFYILINNNGLIETRKVILDILEFKQIKGLIDLSDKVYCYNL